MRRPPVAQSRMFDNVCKLPLSSELFAQAIHPNEPLVAVGLLSGHVQMLRLPQLGESSEPTSLNHIKKLDKPATTNCHNNPKSLLRRSSGSDPGISMVDTQWRTKRHTTSCRTLCFSPDGLELYSAGGEGLVKAANTETGQVEAKILLPKFEHVIVILFDQGANISKIQR
jgi:WD repeat-containing protein 55